MNFKKLLVIESHHLKPVPDPETLTITIAELGEWIRSGKILSQLWKYRESCLLSSQIPLITRPFLCGLTLRLLSRDKCFFNDSLGVRQPISFIYLLRLFVGFIKDWIRIPLILRRHKKAARHLESSVNPVTPTLNLKHPPLYLRTDLSQRLIAGGSITHSRGIINNLHYFLSPPVVVTGVHVPDIPSTHSLHEIEPDIRNRNFVDISLLNTNHRIYEQCRKNFENLSFSIIYHRYSVYNYSGVLLARHFRVPLVIEYNGPEVWVGIHWTRGMKYEKLADRIEILNPMAADVVVVVSQPLKNQLVERGVDSDKILVNPNGVDPELYSPEINGSEIRYKHKLEDKTVIGFIGTFGKWHGAELLAKAYGLLLKTYPDYRKTTRLLLIGDGVTMPQVKNEIEDFCIADNVILTGIVPQEEGPSHLAACDILASPHVPNPDGTPFFGSPTKLFEYMAMGKGIVASDLDQIGEVLQHDHTAWLVKPGEVDSLMHGLKSLIDNPETCKRMGEAARREVVAKYTWKEHTRKIIEKLKERCLCD